MPKGVGEFLECILVLVVGAGALLATGYAIYAVSEVLTK